MAILDGTLAGKGGIGGSVGFWRSSGLYPIPAALFASEADSDIAEDEVAVRDSEGLMSKSKFGSVGFAAGAVDEVERGSDGKRVCVVLRDMVATAGPLSSARDGRVGLESKVARLGWVGARFCSLRPFASALLFLRCTMRFKR